MDGRPPRASASALASPRSWLTTVGRNDVLGRDDRLGPDDRAAHSRRQRVKPARAVCDLDPLAAARYATQSPRRNSSSALVTPLKWTVPSSASRSVPTFSAAEAALSPKLNGHDPIFALSMQKRHPQHSDVSRHLRGCARKQPRPTPAARRAPAFARSGCPPGIQLPGSEMMVGERAARHTNPGASLGVTLAYMGSSL